MESPTIMMAFSSELCARFAATAKSSWTDLRAWEVPSVPLPSLQNTLTWPSVEVIRFLSVSSFSWATLGGLEGALAWALCLFTLFVALVTIPSLCAYRIYVHPLAHIPGPTLGKLSDVYALLLVWKGDSHTKTTECHQKYGTHVRMRPNSVFVDSPQAVRDVYLSKILPLKGEAYDSMSHRSPSTLTARDPEVHAQKRRRLARALNDQALVRQYQPIILSECDRLAALLSEPGRTFDMSHIFDYLTFDIMTQIVFSKSYATLTDTTYRYVIDALQESHTRIAALAYMPILGRLKIDRLFFLPSLLAAKAFLTFMYGLMKWKLTEPTIPPRDMMSYLLNPPQGSEVNAPRKGELYAEAPLLIVGASDTTATTLASLLYYLVHYPLAQRRATDEIRSAFASRDDVRVGPALTSCIYLRACIEETLRLCPPVPGPLIREIPAGGALIDGVWLPGGTEVAAAPYAVHRHPELYPEPERFEPERWIVDETDQCAKVHLQNMRTTFMAFSVGPRSCIGKKLGMMEMSLIIARLLIDFDFEIPEEARPRRSARNFASYPRYEIKDHLNAMKEGPILRFTSRRHLE